MHSLRHLHFAQSLEPLQGGGLGSSATALHQQFLATGVRSTLCSTCGGGPVSHAEQVLEFARWKPDWLYYAPELHRRAGELAAAADVLHGHGLYVATNLLFGREARRQRKLLVYHVHGFLEPYILQRSRWKKRLAHWLFENANFRHAGLWRALTAREAEQIRACGVQAPIVVAPNGLNVADFARPANTAAPIVFPGGATLAKDRPRVLFLGRLHPKKGLDLLLAAWARLHTGHREWQLVVAGPDEQGYLRTLQELIKSLGLAGQVRFTGPVAGPVRNALLYSADVFVLPSYSEGLPMGVLEAMACGVPVLATQACNLPEITVAGAGWECDPSLDSVAASLEQALSAGEAERRERGRRGRSLVETHFSWPRIASSLLEACAAHV